MTQKPAGDDMMRHFFIFCAQLLFSVRGATAASTTPTTTRTTITTITQTTASPGPFRCRGNDVVAIQGAGTCTVSQIASLIPDGQFKCDAYYNEWVQAIDDASAELLSAAVGNGVEFRRSERVPGNSASGWNNDRSYLYLSNCQQNIHLLNAFVTTTPNATTTTTTIATTTATSITQTSTTTTIPTFPPMGSGFYGFSKFSGHVTCADAATIHVVGSMIAPGGRIGHFMNAPAGSKPKSSIIAAGGILLANQVVWKVQVTTQGWIQVSPNSGIPANEVPANKTFFVDLKWKVTSGFCTPLLYLATTTTTVTTTAVTETTNTVTSTTTIATTMCSFPQGCNADCGTRGTVHVSGGPKITRNIGCKIGAGGHCYCWPEYNKECYCWGNSERCQREHSKRHCPTPNTTTTTTTATETETETKTTTSTNTATGTTITTTVSTTTTRTSTEPKNKLSGNPDGQAGGGFSGGSKKNLGDGTAVRNPCPAEQVDPQGCTLFTDAECGTIEFGGAKNVTDICPVLCQNCFSRQEQRQSIREQQPPQKNSSSGASIAGGVIGGLFLLAAILGVGFHFRKEDRTAAMLRDGCVAEMELADVRRNTMSMQENPLAVACRAKVAQQISSEPSNTVVNGMYATIPDNVLASNAGDAYDMIPDFASNAAGQQNDNGYDMLDGLKGGGGGQGFQLGASMAEDAGDAYDMPDGFPSSVPVGDAGDAGDAYDMPDGFDAADAAGGNASLQPQTNAGMNDGYETPSAVLQAAAAAAASSNAVVGNGGYEMPVSVQAGEGSHDDGAYDEVNPYDEIDSAAPYDEVVNPYAEVDKSYKPYDEVDSGAYDEVRQNETEL